MSHTIIWAVVCLGSVGIIAAVVLYFVALKFKVIEDPKIDTVVDVLPGVNCGGCGFAGCRNFAEACVKQGNTENMFCPVGGNAVNSAIADILGIEASLKDPEVAVVRCAGSKTVTSAKISYDGMHSCRLEHNLFAGENGCPNGCFGFGDCVTACNFDAITVNPVTGLPEIIEDKCTACGACIKACPRKIIELRKKTPAKIFVSCVNQEKGAIASKNCRTACIGCSKCHKVCSYDAITIAHHLAYIDANKCTLCRKCVSECPTGAIVEVLGAK